MIQENRLRLVFLQQLLVMAGLWLASRVSGTLQNSTGHCIEPWLLLPFKYISNKALLYCFILTRVKGVLTKPS